MARPGMLARVRKAGFEGPFYEGLLGKARFAFESLAWRTEFIFAGTRESQASAQAPRDVRLVLTTVTSFSDLDRFRAGLEAEYFRGYLDGWRAPFTWGEEVVIGTVDECVAGFAWVQRGTSEGFPTYYGPLFGDEARILRVGVVPGFRRQGVNSAMMYALLQRLLADGFQRVFAETHKYNVPSVRTFLKVGFRP